MGLVLNWFYVVYRMLQSSPNSQRQRDLMRITWRYLSERTARNLHGDGVGYCTESGVRLASLSDFVNLCDQLIFEGFILKKFLRALSFQFFFLHCIESKDLFIYDR